jgi:uncharacterized membrane protein
MIHYISNYLLIGSLFGLLAILMNQHKSSKNKSSKRFSFVENVLLILLWPFYLSIFLYHFFK